MNRKKETYDRYAVGERIQKQRQNLGISQESLAEKMDRATKYCSDIERGICGMSVETMLSFSENLDMSLDYMMYGSKPENENNENREKPSSATPSNEISVERIELDNLLNKCTERQINYALKLMKVFVESTES